MSTQFLGAFGLYGLVLAAISYFFYQKSTDASDFMLGNRSLNYWATAIAAHSSDMSIWLFMGFPGTIYAKGLSITWLAVGLILGMFLAWTYVATALRTATAHYDALTLSDYLEKRFNDTSGALRMGSALLCLLFFSVYISAGLVGMGIMFESVFEIDYHIGILLALITTVSYTFVGGFIGVAWCDLFQGLFLVTMIMMVPILALYRVGDLSLISHAAILKGIPLTFMPKTATQLWGSLILATSWGLGYFGQPHILVNFMGIKNVKDISKARNVGMAWQLLTLGAAVAIGLIGIAYFLEPLPNQELVFVLMVQQLFSPFFAGLVLCAIIAAGLTTIDTQILVAASTFANDFYKKYVNPQATNKQLVLVTKAGIIAMPVISFIIACTSRSVYGLVEYAWCGLGSSFGPALLASLYSKKVTTRGAIVGMIVGGATAALWPLVGSSLPSMIPGFFSNLAILLIMSKK